MPAARSTSCTREVIAVVAMVMSCVASLAAAAPAQSHFWLAAHHDWTAKKGYFLVLENTFDVGSPSKLSDARLILAVADGHDFRYLKSEQPLTLDHEYSVKAVVNANTAELWLDGKRIAQSPGGTFVPNDHLESCGWERSNHSSSGAAADPLVLALDFATWKRLLPATRSSSSARARSSR